MQFLMNLLAAWIFGWPPGPFRWFSRLTGLVVVCTKDRCWFERPRPEG